MRIPPADLNHGQAGSSRVSIDDLTSFGLDTALIVSDGDLMPHHGKRPLDGGRNDWRGGGFAVPRKFTGSTMIESTGLQFHQVRNRQR